MQRLKAKTGKRRQVYADACLDESGWSPEALNRLLELSSRLSYEEASHVARRFGLTISGSSLELLTSPYAQHCEQAVAELLTLGSSKDSPDTAHRDTASHHLSQDPPNHQPSLQQPQTHQLSPSHPTTSSPTAASTAQAGRIMVLQLDGVYVLGRPVAGSCPGLELKSVVFYPQNSPRQRAMLASRCSAEDLLPLLSGLLERKLRPQDSLICLGDGAAWIDSCSDMFQAFRITDVYHACDYLDTVMQALAWNPDERQQHRCSWYRGSVNARDWLADHLPQPDVWLTWSEEAQAALRYLESRLDSMDYAVFKQKGYPIGSGQVEGVNKFVIGRRLKASGMHWSEHGASAMASLRAQFCAELPLVNFEQIRFRAFALD